MLTRALVTFAFVLFCVASVLVFNFCAVSFFWFWPLGILVSAVWSVVAIPFVGALVVVWLKDERPQFLPSDIYFEKREYQSWSARHGWPRASYLFYECGICHKSLPSETTMARRCGCGNLFVGPDHIGASNSAKVRLYEE